VSNYEMMYIVRPDLSEDRVDETAAKYRDYLGENGVDDIKIQIRGKRRLAYPIGKYLDGIYIQMNYQADGSQIASLERMMRLNEDVIRYLTLKLKRNPVEIGETQVIDSVGEEE
jgi:small subunit ribosomal protein S6